MIAVEFVHNEFKHSIPNPNPISQKICKKAEELGLLIMTASIYDTIRLIPPLNVSKEELKDGIDLLCKAVKYVFQKA